MANAQIYRDSLSAWQALTSMGGLEPAGRDEELVELLRLRLDPSSPTLEDALARVSINGFLNALFALIQPFVGMFRDILLFFRNAGARHGQGQWRLKIGDEIAELKHFEEFLETWSRVEFDIDVPALDLRNAFALLDVLYQMADEKLLSFDPNPRSSAIVHTEDVRDWLDAYKAGRYSRFPGSLAPDRQPEGLDDAARVVIAALHVIHERGLSRHEMIAEHKARSFASEGSDAFHPWTIAQSETDFWLRTLVELLSKLKGETPAVRNEVGRRLSEFHGRFGRRRLSINGDVRALERLLSLPVWKRRYEAYGVWVATQMIEALHDHDVAVQHDEGVLRFAFAETRLADIESSRPPLSLYTERRSPLADPVGKSRVAAVQPDYGIWTRGGENSVCVLVVEVKHYKKESTSNFGAALSDYSRAHPQAKVVLVNYGPGGADYGRTLGGEKGRCTVIGHFNPDRPDARRQFSEIVSGAVGRPFRHGLASAALGKSGIVALDVSASMASIFESDWFRSLARNPDHKDLAFFLIDSGLRATVPAHQLNGWIESATLGSSTSLSAEIGTLIDRHQTVTLITDEEGAAGLVDIEHTRVELLDAPLGVRLLRLGRL